MLDEMSSVKRHLAKLMKIVMPLKSIALLPKEAKKKPEGVDSDSTPDEDPKAVLEALS
jgi:hypothetical protein